MTTFFSPQLFTEDQRLLHRKLSFSEVPEGIQHFPGGGGVQLFPGGSNGFLPIETNITCDFPGGMGPDPCPHSGSTHGKNSKHVESRSNPSVSQRLIPGIVHHSAEWFGFCTHI